MRTMLAALTALSLIPAAALAQETPPAPAPAPGPYASGTLGYVFNDDASYERGGSIRRDDGYAVRAALGHQYGDFRAEGELGWQRADSTSGHIKAVTGMANAFYDLRTPTLFTPYVGGGLGTAWVDFNSVSPAVAGRIDDNDWAFAWQLMAGLSYAIAPRMDVFGGYRYFDIGEASVRSANLGDVDVDGLASHNIEVGVRYRF